VLYVIVEVSIFWVTLIAEEVLTCFALVWIVPEVFELFCELGFYGEEGVSIDELDLSESDQAFLNELGEIAWTSCRHFV
jgi:hypothetical protein